MCVKEFWVGRDALESEELKKTDVIIMDIGLPGMNGIEGVRAIKATHPKVQIIMATVHDDNEHIFEAIKAGAVGYLMKKVTPDELVAAVKDAHEGGSPITPNIARKIIAKMHAPIVSEEEQLTERELEILQELATGKSYAAIGKSIFYRWMVFVIISAIFIKNYKFIRAQKL